MHVKHLLLGAAIGAVVGTAASSIWTQHHIDRIAHDAYLRQTKRINVSVEVIPPTQHPSEKEDFIPSYAATEALPLDAKRGFRFVVEGIRREFNPDSPIFESYTGTIETFAIEDMPGGHAVEQLTIATYDGFWEPESLIFLQDHDQDRILDHISLEDKVHRLSASISRGSSGLLIYTNLDEESARDLFDRYTSLYHTFRADNKIGDLLTEYQPVLEIKDIRPAEITPTTSRTASGTPANPVH